MTRIATSLLLARVQTESFPPTLDCKKLRVNGVSDFISPKALRVLVQIWASGVLQPLAQSKESGFGGYLLDPSSPHLFIVANSISNQYKRGRGGWAIF